MAISATQSEFLRLEDKYLIPVSHLPALKELISKNVATTWDHYHIRSIYFDSINLELFSQHIQNLDQRYKLRLRTYSANEEFKSDVFFAEYKKKDQGLTEKKRFQIDYSLKEELMHGNPFENENVLLTFNPDTKPKQIKKVVKSVNDLLRVYHLVPVMQVSYARAAIEKDGLRLTIDDHLNFVPLSECPLQSENLNFDDEEYRRFQSYRNSFHPSSHVVLEVKHMNNFPKWLSDFLTETLILPARFSKYIWAVGNVISLGARNSQSSTEKSEVVV